ncbi:MAG: hypothetical protein LAT68_10555 [Cyclobacteriaceae bacterium]|nr:hypothetical protein [Cyclobacteriaceae bacterium]MCH8516756.1 hypothetical protein [Cyclobacteriaceae bacterium]
MNKRLLFYISFWALSLSPAFSQGFEVMLRPIGFQFVTSAVPEFSRSYGFGPAATLNYEFRFKSDRPHAIAPQLGRGVQAFRNRDGGKILAYDYRFGLEYRYYLGEDQRLSVGATYLTFMQTYQDEIVRHWRSDPDYENTNYQINLSYGLGSYEKGYFITFGYSYSLLRSFVATRVDRWGENIERVRLFRPNGLYIQTEINLKKL